MSFLIRLLPTLFLATLLFNNALAQENTAQCAIIADNANENLAYHQEHANECNLRNEQDAYWYSTRSFQPASREGDILSEGTIEKLYAGLDRARGSRTFFENKLSKCEADLEKLEKDATETQSQASDCVGADKYAKEIAEIRTQYNSGIENTKSIIKIYEDAAVNIRLSLSSMGQDVDNPQRPSPSNKITGPIRSLTAD